MSAASSQSIANLWQNSLYFEVECTFILALNAARNPTDALIKLQRFHEVNGILEGIEFICSITVAYHPAGINFNQFTRY